MLRVELMNIYDDIDSYSGNDLLEYIDDYLIVILHNDPKINMVNGGSTIYYKTNDNYFMFSEGQNWRDIEETLLDKDMLVKFLEKAIEAVEDDFEKYEFDTTDTNCCWISITDYNYRL